MNAGHYMLAESICRRYYEKRYNIDLDAPDGHPSRRIKGDKKDFLKDMLCLWCDMIDEFKPSFQNLDGLPREKLQREYLNIAMCTILGQKRIESLKMLDQYCNYH